MFCSDPIADEKFCEEQNTFLSILAPRKIANFISSAP